MMGAPHLYALVQTNHLQLSFLHIYGTKFKLHINVKS